MWKFCCAMSLAVCVPLNAWCSELVLGPAYTIPAPHLDVSSPSKIATFRLTERFGLDFQSSHNQQTSLSLSYTPFERFGAKQNYGIGKEEPLTFRITIKGWELLETDTESGKSQFLSLDRYRESSVRKQYIALSVSKRF